MKNSPKFILAGLVLLAASVLRAAEPTSPSAGKPDRPPGRPERREEMRENAQKMAEELNLTDEQKAKTKAIHDQTGDALKAIHKDASLSEEQKREKAKALRDSTQEQVRALLTPEQQAKAKEMRGKHGNKKQGDKKHGDKKQGEKPRGENPVSN